MSTHSSGDGAGWKEDLDVDQPHGEDYLEFNDVRIGTRLRMSQEHTAFADSTAGGIHKPGGCAVLAMDITNAAGDPTGNVVADGTYRGHGLAWTYVVEAGANKGLLWCATAAAGASTTGDWTLVKLHPDLQWAGGDVTWQGAHQYDSSVEFLDPVDFTGPVTVDGSCDFSDVFIAGDISVAGKFIIDSSADFSDVYIEGDLTVKGDFKVDSTATEFGGTAGIGLFYDPTSYTGAVSKETSAIGNGLIIKMGDAGSIAGGATKTITYGDAFPNGFVACFGSIHTSGGVVNDGEVLTRPKAGAGNDLTDLEIVNGDAAAAQSVFWLAIGY